MRANGFGLQAIADEITRIEAEAAIESGQPLPEKPRSASTISRELRRNRTKTGRYNPRVAHEMAMERRERVVSNSALKPGVLGRALKLLREKRWSPEQISGFLRRQGVAISSERIYQEIRSTPELAQYCHHRMKYRRHRRKKYSTAGRTMIPDRVSIHQRPPEADGTRFGDWEMDLVVGADQKSAVLTLVERSVNMFMQAKLPSKKPEVVARTVNRLLFPYREHVLTITTDNGVEFRDHRVIAQALGCRVYFATRTAPGKRALWRTQTRFSANISPRALTLGWLRKRNLTRCST